MPLGFLLIKTIPTCEHDIYAEITSIPQVVNAYTLFGEHDLLAKVEVDDYGIEPHCQ